MLRIDGDPLNPLNYSCNDIFLAQEETCLAIGVINPSVISLCGWLLLAAGPWLCPPSYP